MSGDHAISKLLRLEPALTDAWDDNLHRSNRWAFALPCNFLQLDVEAAGNFGAKLRIETDRVKPPVRNPCPHGH
jgi:hypothetical protein